MNQVLLIKEAVSRHESWDDAVQEICTATRVARERMWVRPAERGGGYLIFEGKPSRKQEAIARILTPVEYQAALSSGDLLEPEAFAHPAVVRTQTNFIPLEVPSSAGPTDQPTMKPPTTKKAKPTRETYIVLKPVMWQGQSRTVGEKIDFAAKGSHSNRDRWLDKGAIRLATEEEIADRRKIIDLLAKATEQNNTHLHKSLGVSIGDLLHGVVLKCGGRADWKVDNWHPEEGASILRLAEAEQSQIGNVKGSLSIPVMNPERKGKRIVGNHHGEIVVFDIVKNDACAKDAAGPELFAQPNTGPRKLDPVAALAPPLREVEMSREDMQAIGEKVECQKLSDRGSKAKVPGVRTFEFEGEKYVAISSTSSRDTGYSQIDACPLLKTSQILGGSVPKVRDWSAGRMCHYGQPVTVQGKPHMLGAETLKIVQAKVAPKAAAPDRFEQIRRLDIDPSPWNPRKDFTSAAALEYLDGLAQSIREQGIIQPITVRQVPEDPDRYEIVAGECRWRAAGRAGLEVVPCIVKDLTEEAAIKAQAVENLQRRDINALEEADGYALLMSRGKMSVADIARETGKSEATIYARLKLRDTPPGIRKALAEGRIPASTAELVARIDDVAFQGAAMDAILFPEFGEAEDGADVLSFRQAKAWIEHKRAEFAREAEWTKRQKDSHVIKDAAQVLSAAESDKVLLTGGYVRDSQAFLKPTDTCPADPQGRTFEAIAREAGRELPSPIVARDPEKGAPVVILPRGETEKALVDLIPSVEEQQRRRREADEQRRADIDAANQVRAEQRAVAKRALDQLEVRAVDVVHEVKTRRLDGDDEEELLRFVVGSMLHRLDDDCFAAALRSMRVPVEKGEEATVGEHEWRVEYLRGCTSSQLLAWLVWGSVRDMDGDGTSYGIDEDRVQDAEILLGLREEKPQTSAVAEEEEREVTLR